MSTRDHRDDEHGVRDTHESATAGHHPTGAAETGYDEHRQREAYGGINWGAGFFGWLVAVAVGVLLTSIVGAVAAGVGASSDVSQSDADRQAGTISIVAAVILLIILMLAYYTGGYVAGRMSRFDGGKQGLAAWVIGLVVTIVAVVLGLVFGDEYNLLDRVNLPNLPLSGDELTWGGVITAAAILVGTLIAAMAGGKVGSRYHKKVDRAAYQ